MTGTETWVVLGFFAAYVLPFLWLLLWRRDLLRLRSLQAIAGLFAIGLAQVWLVFRATWFEPSEAARLLANYGFVVEIGLLVGATEMISRYRDDPFAPLVSTPGVFYIMINGGAAALAYYLMGPLHVTLEDPLRVLVAGLGAMAFFRSGIFTARVGGSDLAVGPNLVLQVVLQALDRTWDRQRAVPRSTDVAKIMRGVSFSQVKDALPTLCFDLMQNVSQGEISAINAQKTELAASLTMSEEAKMLSLGLALFNLVGQDTLGAAVVALGNDAKGFRKVSQQMLLDLGAIDPAVVVAELPAVCAALPSETELALPAPDLTLAGLKLSPEAGSVLLLYKLAAYYGEPRVAVAIGILATQANQPIVPPPAAPPAGLASGPSTPPTAPRAALGVDPSGAVRDEGASGLKSNP